MANEQNLRTPTTEEARTRGRKGGIASGIARREKRTMRELLEMVLAQPVTNTKGETATMKEEQQTEIHVICKKGDVWQLGDRQLKCGDRVRLEQVKELMK